MSEMLKAMEYIWERVPKNAEGLIQYSQADVDYLYYHGFVDIKRFSLKKWQEAVLPYRTSQGGYLFNKKQFLAMRYYRPIENVTPAFDATTLDEGYYTLEQMEEIYVDFIAPSSILKQDVYMSFIRELMNRGWKDESNHFRLDLASQSGLNILIENFASPQRRLQKEVARIKNERQSKQGDPNYTGFSVGKSTIESQHDSYNKLKGTKSVDVNAVLDEATAVSLKNLRKPSGKLRG